MSAGVVVAVRITPRASREAIDGADEAGQIRIRVTAAPAEGAANRAVLRLMAKTLGLRRGAVTLVAGASNRHKRLRIEGVDAAVLRSRWPGAQVSDA